MGLVAAILNYASIFRPQQLASVGTECKRRIGRAATPLRRSASPAAI